MLAIKSFIIFSKIPQNYKFQKSTILYGNFKNIKFQQIFKQRRSKEEHLLCSGPELTKT
jgi:hypothetical protein